MRTIAFIFALLLPLSVLSQQDTTNKIMHLDHAPYEKNTTIASISVGFVDAYRQSYSVPNGFEKSNTSGFCPLYGKLEYGAGKHFGIAATFSYDAFVYNYNQLYTGYNGTIRRYKANRFRLFSGGVMGYYHFTQLFHSRRIDPFVGVGISLNNISYSAYPQGDSTIGKTDHTATPSIKAGIRYYLTDQFSLFGDAGYDNQSIVSIGLSCRFLPKKDGAK